MEEGFELDGKRVITRKAIGTIPAGADGVIIGRVLAGPLTRYIVSVYPNFEEIEYARREIFVEGVDPQYEREMGRRKAADDAAPILDRKPRHTGGTKTNVKHASYGWSPADLELMRLAKERYQIVSDVETLRLGLVALVSGEWPQKRG